VADWAGWAANRGLEQYLSKTEINIKSRECLSQHEVKLSPYGQQGSTIVLNIK